MNKLKKYLFIYFGCCLFQTANAYVLSQTKSGGSVHWPTSSSVVDIYVNTQNGQSFDEAQAQSIAELSIAQWNSIAGVMLRKNVTANRNQDDLNELYFSTDPTIFNGSGVIGVTQVGFKEDNGEIIEADILLNDNFPFSATPTDSAYLGNVITHEAGHFLGLGHGQVSGSTMFYALSRGQHQISTDDKAGLFSIYPNSNTTLGALTGTIVGGKNLTSVFGAHVQAISVKTGKVVASSISEVSGRFRIDGLLINDQYLIYTSPIKQIGLPSNYANVRSDFCDTSTKYRGSFFQSCEASSEGFPQAIRLSSSLIEVGKVTIRCGLDAPPEYLSNKGASSVQFDVNSYSASGLGGSFVGFFSTAEMTSGTAIDKFRLNLSNVSDWDTISTSTSLYVHLKVTNQAFYSPFKANVSVTRSGVTTSFTPKFHQESDGRMSIDTDVYIPINRASSSDNDLVFQISPEDMKSGVPTGIPYSRSDYFPSMEYFVDSLYFYLATVDVVKRNGDGPYIQVSSRIDALSDNATCPDAINTYALTSYSATGTPSSNTDRKKAAMGCGTIDLKGGPSGGPGGFMVGLILSFLVSYALSRYSKMA